ncbi:MAG: alanine racemase [Labilithrix sp.]|nr:alanine racemase [Labilithrix sp.]
MSLSYEAFKRALASERLPAMVVDLDALDRNVDRVLALIAPSKLPLRVATKSVRVPALLRRILTRGGAAMRGLMTYTIDEAALLATQGFDDLFVAYPQTSRSDLERAAGLVARGVTLRLAVDAEPHLRRISEVGEAHGVRVPVVICADMSLRLLGDRIHLGVRRSPIATPEDAIAIARAASELAGVTLVGLMGYEAQIAGLADDHASDAPPMRAAKRSVRSMSVRVVRERRAALVRALRAEGHTLSIVNGGGTASLDSTTNDDFVTEVTCGSAFFKPHLFDNFTNAHVRSLEPACFFALEVTRVPAPGFATCLGGGYVASGDAGRGGRTSAPLPWLPGGLALLAGEMAGEVQTPLRVAPGASVTHGDPVIFRHAKAGEIAERFTHALLLQGGSDARVVDRALTYRGLGACFV